MTRRPLKPLRTTSAAWPFGAHPARKGGNNSRSVSSSLTIAVSNPKRRTNRRSARFFLCVRVGVEDVAQALPDITLTLQLAADCVLRELVARLVLDLLGKERRRPIHGKGAQLVR